MSKKLIYIVSNGTESQMLSFSNKNARPIQEVYHNKMHLILQLQYNEALVALHPNPRGIIMWSACIPQAYVILLRNETPTHIIHKILIIIHILSLQCECNRWWIFFHLSKTKIKISDL